MKTKHDISLSINNFPVIDAADLPIGEFGLVVSNDQYLGKVITRIWKDVYNGETGVYLVLLNDPRTTWRNMPRGVFQVIQLPVGSKMEIAIGSNR